MLHLSRSPKNKKYYVAALAKNHLELVASQPKGLSSHRAAIKNIRAQMKVFDVPYVLVQDNTLPVPMIIKVRTTTIVAVPYRKTYKPYMPGQKK